MSICCFPEHSAFCFFLEPSALVILLHDHVTKIAYTEANGKAYLSLAIYIFQCLI